MLESAHRALVGRRQSGCGAPALAEIQNVGRSPFGRKISTLLRLGVIDLASVLSRQKNTTLLFVVLIDQMPRLARSVIFAIPIQKHIRLEIQIRRYRFDIRRGKLDIPIAPTAIATAVASELADGIGPDGGILFRHGQRTVRRKSGRTGQRAGRRIPTSGRTLPCAPARCRVPFPSRSGRHLFGPAPSP